MFEVSLGGVKSFAPFRRGTAVDVSPALRSAVIEGSAGEVPLVAG